MDHPASDSLRLQKNGENCMKKLIAALILVSLLAACFPAFADVTDGTPLVSYGFTLNLDAGITYESTGTSKEDFELIVTPFPDFTHANIIFGWLGTDGYLITQLKAFMPNAEAEYRATLEAKGKSIDQFSISSIQYLAIGSQDCFAYRTDMSVIDNASHETTELHQCVVWCTATGHAICLQAERPEVLERLIEWLDRAVAWN